MKLTQVCNAQHLGWMFKKLWHVKKVCEPKKCSPVLESYLAKLGLTEPSDTMIIKSKTEIPKFDSDNNIFTISNDNIMLHGLPQAQLLTKTIVINEMPKNIENTIRKSKIPQSVHKNVQDAIISVNEYVPKQEKLDIVKETHRTFPRKYGLNDFNKSQIISTSLLQECVKQNDVNTNKSRRIFNDFYYNAIVNKNTEKFKFAFFADTIIMSTQTINTVAQNFDENLPDLYPLRYTSFIPRADILEENLSSKVWKSLYPHAIMTYYTLPKKGNLKSLNTDSQFEAMNMLRAFSLATAKAKQLYGETARDNIKSISVQSIQTNGKTFHFGVYQLNTLNLDNNNGQKNYWFRTDGIDLYDNVQNIDGKLILNGYNEHVVNTLMAFYNSN